MRTREILAIAACAFSLSLAAQTAPSLADMEPVLAKVAAWDPAQARDPLYEFTNFLRAALNSKSELPQIEARLLLMLAPDSKTSTAGKEFVCRQLSLIGTDASVPALARLLNDPTMAEMARYSLARIPGPAAGAALRKSLPQPGVIKALGERRDAQAVPALKNLLGSSDAATFDAALDALAQIGTSDALAAIQAALSAAKGPRRESILRAYIRCVDTIGTRDAYLQLIGQDEPPMIRIAALHGLAKVDGQAAIPLLEKELGASNADVQAAAIRLLNAQRGAPVTAIFVKRYPGLPPAAQIRVLTALRERDDAGAARPVDHRGFEEHRAGSPRSGNRHPRQSRRWNVRAAAGGPGSQRHKATNRPRRAKALPWCTAPAWTPRSDRRSRPPPAKCSWN